MKMDRIRFLRVYADGEPQYFKPYKDKDIGQVFDRTVILEPGDAKGMNKRVRRWVTFKIVDNYDSHRFWMDPPLRKWTRAEASFHPHDYPEVAQLIINLASGDLRQRLAEDTASILYWKLFAFSREMRKWLPGVAKENRKLEKEAHSKKRRR